MYRSVHRVLGAALMALGAACLAAPPAHPISPSRGSGRIARWSSTPTSTIRSTGSNLSLDKRIAGFINKASDGLPPAYACSGDETETRLCKALWKRHAVARELFHTRRTVAKALGLKWGAYHLARPGNPIDQANNFLDFAEPAPDDLIALDIEDNDPEQWMSLEDAEEFARHIHRRTGRFPLLYTNGTTAAATSPPTATATGCCRACRSGMRATSPRSASISRRATGRPTRSGNSRRRPIATPPPAPTACRARRSTSTSTSPR